MDNKNKMLFSALVAASALGAAEGVLRLRDRANSHARFLREHRTHERAWEQFDPKSGWELKPGFISDDVRINRKGFRGPEPIKGDLRKVVCLGDSLTFGSAGEKNTFPHALQIELDSNCSGKPVDVINAGISGHTTYNMLFRLNRVTRFNPDVIIVLAGWDDLYEEPINRYRDNRQPFSSFWHIESQKNVRFHVWSLLCETMLSKNRKPFPLSYTPDEFVPFNFEYNLTQIIDCIRKYSAEPVLVTLPKLVPGDLSLLSQEDRKKILLPDFIEEGDLESFLKVFLSYDMIIRALAQEKEIPLIDSEKMFGEPGITRGSLFEDSRHLSEEGYSRLGKVIARELDGKGLLA
jgi:lysophospholipase L1-like esterase